MNKLTDNISEAIGGKNKLAFEGVGSGGSGRMYESIIPENPNKAYMEAIEELRGKKGGGQ